MSMSTNPDFDKLRIGFGPVERKIIESHRGIVDGIALFMGTHCEVALLSLEEPEKALVMIRNGHHTNREVGAPLTETAAELLLKFQQTGRQPDSCYTTTSSKGAPMRSVFSVITNGDRPIGLLNINFNMNVPLADFISTFSLFSSGQQEIRPDTDRTSTSPVDDLVHQAVSEVVQDISRDIRIPNHEKNKYIVFGLQEKGIFDIKGAVMMVADELKLSKFTIYSYIREMRDNPPGPSS
jgi:predicted transcriptional regulator YheO